MNKHKVTKLGGGGPGSSLEPPKRAGLVTLANGLIIGHESLGMDVSLILSTLKLIGSSYGVKSRHCKTHRCSLHLNSYLYSFTSVAPFPFPERLLGG